MEDIKESAEKLIELSILSKDADDGFKKASVYAATEQLVTFFEIKNLESGPFPLYKLLEARSYINSVIGYSEPINGGKLAAYDAACLAATTFKDLLINHYEL
ncbi:hypothetical protein [Pseudoalteromonas aliena]|uniref:hypothetical protein n=1 Tax=Pseudoalteromonas aliena TaxID=247523 RepID=UPI002494C1BF|nr:hypothetical protein [Pseudoalteromonas aliena]